MKVKTYPRILGILGRGPSFTVSQIAAPKRIIRYISQLPICILPLCFHFCLQPIITTKNTVDTPHMESNQTVSHSRLLCSVPCLILLTTQDSSGFAIPVPLGPAISMLERARVTPISYVGCRPITSLVRPNRRRDFWCFHTRSCGQAL